MPDCVGEGAAAALAMVGVGMGDRGVVLGGDASMVDGMVDMGTEAGAESAPSCAGVVLEPTQ